MAAVAPEMTAVMARITAVPRSLDRFISLPLALALFVVRADRNSPQPPPWSEPRNGPRTRRSSCIWGSASHLGNATGNEAGCETQRAGPGAISHGDRVGASISSRAVVLTSLRARLHRTLLEQSQCSCKNLWNNLTDQSSCSARPSGLAQPDILQAVCTTWVHRESVQLRQPGIDVRWVVERDIRGVLRDDRLDLGVERGASALSSSASASRTRAIAVGSS